MTVALAQWPPSPRPSQSLLLLLYRSRYALNDYIEPLESKASLLHKEIIHQKEIDKSKSRLQCRASNIDLMEFLGASFMKVESEALDDTAGCSDVHQVGGISPLDIHSSEKGIRDMT